MLALSLLRYTWAVSPDTFHRVALQLPAAQYGLKWQDKRVYTVGGRMFATGGRLGDAEPRQAFKASFMTYELLIYAGVARPAPYLARAHWVELMAPDAIPDEELCGYLAQAHGLVAGALTRACRRSLGLRPDEPNAHLVRR